MRVLTILLASVTLSFAAGCATARPEAAKMPEPIAYDAADYNPPSEFDMKFVAAQGPAVKRSTPNEGSYAPRLVSMEKNTTQQ
jgi:hypothetical protein